MKNLGFVIILAGLVLTIFSVVTVFTREKVVDLGKVEITRDKPHNLNISPFIGVAVMGVGGVIVFMSRKKG
ncbi:MAG: hypothetical protein CVU13_10860 [Bacteroidetes bacterium HGW-Bacteroidetes-8]|jgi:hypothetical protein|nr:MAG: hypothetical protein CVU13_10860 [Bacteroidetes bacterium HGW-Bacteroidetes-8]